MKKIISIILLLVITFSAVGTTAFATNDSIASGAVNENISTTDEKLICNTTINDDFETDSIIVVLNNAKSRELKEYTAADFSDVSAVSVKNLTEATMNKIEKQRGIENVSRNINLTDVSSTTGELYVDEGTFHQILLIKLNQASKANVLKCIKILEKRDEILSAEPNSFERMCATPNDPIYTQKLQWGIDKINLPAAWSITTGSSSVKVGVIDTGIQGNHPDLTNRVNRSLSKDFTGGNSPLTDPEGHGTKVAGVIGAQGNNATDITGVCWNVSLVSLKAANLVDGDYSVSVECFIDALEYAQDNNIPIVNYSYSGKTFNNARQTAIANYGGLFICAAGNDGNNISNTKEYPSCYNLDNMISVAKSNSSDALVSNSNYSNKYVDLAAPGDSIYTTNRNGSYSVTGGTSIAAPHVAGVAALLKSKYPAMNAQGLKYYIEAGVDKLPAFSGKVVTGGRLNAYKSLNKVKQYTVKYDKNGGTGTMADTTVIYGNPTLLRKNQFTNGSATFMYWHAKRASDGKWYYTNGTSSGKGWYLEGSQPEGYYKYQFTDQISVKGTSPVNNDVVTMYAQWRVLYTVGFNGNSGTGSMQSMQVQYGVPTELRSNTFVKNRFVFDHWYAKNADGNTYYVGSDGAYSWCKPANKPSGYSRKVFSDTGYIHTLEGVADGDMITLYAYWEPTFGVLGDADLDGSVTVKDATEIQKYKAGLVTFTADQILLGDVNYSGAADINDATVIQKYLADTSADYFEY